MTSIQDAPQSPMVRRTRLSAIELLREAAEIAATAHVSSRQTRELKERGYEDPLAVALAIELYNQKVELVKRKYPHSRLRLEKIPQLQPHDPGNVTARSGCPLPMLSVAAAHISGDQPVNPALATEYQRQQRTLALARGDTVDDGEQPVVRLGELPPEKIVVPQRDTNFFFRRILSHLLQNHVFPRMPEVRSEKPGRVKTEGSFSFFQVGEEFFTSRMFCFRSAKDFEAALRVFHQFLTDKPPSEQLARQISLTAKHEAQHIEQYLRFPHSNSKSIGYILIIGMCVSQQPKGNPRTLEIPANSYHIPEFQLHSPRHEAYVALRAASITAAPAALSLGDRTTLAELGHPLGSALSVELASILHNREVDRDERLGRPQQLERVPLLPTYPPQEVQHHLHPPGHPQYSGTPLPLLRLTDAQLTGYESVSPYYQIEYEIQQLLRGAAQRGDLAPDPSPELALTVTPPAKTRQPPPRRVDVAAARMPTGSSIQVS